jgi:hypothetical protein
VHEEWIERERWPPATDRASQNGATPSRRSFVGEVKRKLGARACYRRLVDEDGTAVLREAEEHYGVISRSKWAA